MDGDGGTATKTARIVAEGGAGAGGSIATGSNSNDLPDYVDVDVDEAQDPVIEAAEAALALVARDKETPYSDDDEATLAALKAKLAALEAKEENLKAKWKLLVKKLVADNAALMQKLAASEADKAELEKRNKRLVEASKKLFSAAMAEAG